MTDARLAEVEACAAAAVDPDPPETAGPLRLQARFVQVGDDPTPYDIGIEDVDADGTIAWMETDGDAMLAAARFMAAAPELLDEVRRLRAIVNVGVEEPAPAHPPEHAGPYSRYGETRDLPCSECRLREHESAIAAWDRERIAEKATGGTGTGEVKP